MNLPKSTEVNRFIPKKKFYDRTNMGESLKRSFINDLEKIIWSYKLSEDTLNISKSDNINEIEIFTLYLNNKIIPNSIIKSICKLIPYKILFILKYQNESCYVVLENNIVYNSSWNEVIDFIFTGLNLEIVWNNIIKSIIKEENNNSNIEDILDNKNRIDELRKEINRLEILASREKQFNRQIEIDHEIKRLKKEMEDLDNE